MEDKDRKPPDREPPANPEDQPTLDHVPSPAPGGLAARYDILSELGRGGMGIVYKARDRETGAIVALKVLRPEIAADAQVLERFKNEVLLARKITHKNVCRIHEFNRTQDTAYISMEYVEGESLRHILLRSGGLRAGKAIQIAQQICAGLREAHSQGVVHRDLKPENVMLDPAGQVKIMDFGIARSTEGGQTQAGALVGTPAYMSPEQAEGKPADARSDLYSLGLILYEMFTGATAFQGDTPFAIALKQIHETPPFPREAEPLLPAHIEKLILKCLEKNAGKRFQSVDELEAALTQKAEARPVAPGGAEVALPVHLTRWQRSDWVLVFLAIAGLALFFPFFERTSLAPRSKVSFDRSVLRRIAQEHAQRLGAPVGKESQIGVVSLADEYDSVAQRAGARAALELANNPVPYWTWRVVWENGTRVKVDSRGSLVTFTRDFPASPAIERLPIEEARPLAEKALREFFNRDPALLLVETATGDKWRGQPAVAFAWEDRNDYHGLRRRFVVWLVGRDIAALNAWFDLPPGYVFFNVLLQILPMLALVFVASWGISQRQAVELGARWRTVAAAGGFVVGIWYGWCVVFPGERTLFKAMVSGAFGLPFALGLFFILVATERSVCRTAPAGFSSLVGMFDRKATSEPCGLAMLRGTLVGLALLGADAFLVWLGTERLGMRLDAYRNVAMQGYPFLSNPWPSTHVLLNALYHTMLIAALVVFLASFLARFVRRSWLAVFLAAALAAASIPGPHVQLGAVQPYHWKLVLLLFDCLVLAWAFTRFDVLTVGWAVFTFAFFWQNYFLLVMFEPTGAVEQWAAFAVWGLFVAAAAVVAFKTPLRAAYQRAATAFE